MSHNILSKKKIVEKDTKIDERIHLTKINNETETFIVKRIGKDIGQQIVNARIAKNWNQKQLAGFMSEPIRTVVDFENGSAVYDSQKLSKFARILNIKFNK